MPATVTLPLLAPPRVTVWFAIAVLLGVQLTAKVKLPDTPPAGPPLTFFVMVSVPGSPTSVLRTITVIGVAGPSAGVGSGSTTGAPDQA